MTQNKNGNVFLFYMAKEGEKTIPSEITVTSIEPTKGARIQLLGSEKYLKWKKNEKGFTVFVPKNFRNKPFSKYVWTFKISSVK